MIDLLHKNLYEDYGLVRNALLWEESRGGLDRGVVELRRMQNERCIEDFQPANADIR